MSEETKEQNTETENEAAAANEEAKKADGEETIVNPDLYRPEGLDESMFGESDQETMDNMAKRIKGLREELGKNRKAPETPDDYEFDFGDLSDKILKPGDDGKDPLLEHMKGVFHAHDVDNEVAQALIMDFYQQAIASQAQADPGSEGEGEDVGVPLDFDFEGMGGAEKAKPLVDAVTAWAGSLEGLSDGAKEDIEALLTHSSGVELLNKWRESTGEKPIPTNVDNGEGEKGITEDELNAMMRDKRYWLEKDPAYVEKVTKAFQEFYN